MSHPDVLFEHPPFGVVIRAREPSGFEVTASPGLVTKTIRDARGDVVGSLHGAHIAPEPGAFTATAEEIRLSAPVASPEDFVREAIDRIHGCYVARTHGALPERLYQDCGGSIPIVYCPASRRAASSPAMIFDDAEYEARLLRDRVERLIRREGRSGWISGYLTAHRDLFRLLPNHYLDLSTWQAHRYWPTPDTFTFGTGLEEAAQDVAARLKAFMLAASSTLRVAVTLTAGFDSRILLAACNGATDRIGFITGGKPDEGLDQTAAAELAARLGLRHRLVPFIHASPAAEALWDRRVGDAVREVNRSIHPTWFALEGYDAVATGMYGETGRSRLYRQDISTINDQSATARFVISRLTLPTDDDVLASVEAWLAPIAWAPRSVVLDLAFNELRFGSWAMGQGPAQGGAMLWLMPFAQRPIMDAFMAVPPEIKGTSALFERIGETLWPDAMRYPINRYGDYRDVTSKLKKLGNRESVIRFLRDRLAGWI